MQNSKVEIKGRLRGGMESEEASFICWNVSGFPSNRSNMHKAKEIQKMAVGVEGMIILETGVNKDAKIFLPDDNLEIGKENKMQEVERGQY